MSGSIAPSTASSSSSPTSPAKPSSSGDRVWLRKCSLIVGKQTDEGLDLSALRIRFEVFQNMLGTPGHAVIRVYNLADATVKKLLAQKLDYLDERGASPGPLVPEFTRVWLQAGYEGQGQFGPIFFGQIKQFRHGREPDNPVDTYLDIFAADTDLAYNYSFSSGTLSAGYTQDDLRQKLLQDMKPFEVTAGLTQAQPAQWQSPRGRACFALTRDEMRRWAATNNLTWSFNNGQLVTAPKDPPSQQKAAVVLTSETGLLGFPEQTLEGIAVRCLLNPKITWGSIVQINQASIQQALLPASLQGQASFVPPDVSKDGFYRVTSVNYIGDTRGHPWLNEMLCQPLTGQQSLSTAPLRTLPNSNQ
jgi:hypothetical protein